MMLELDTHDEVAADPDGVSAHAVGAELPPTSRTDATQPETFAARIVGRRYGLSPDRAKLIAELAGLGQRDDR